MQFNNGEGLKMAFDTFCKKTCSTCKGKSECKGKTEWMKFLTNILFINKAECTATTCQNKGTCSLDATQAVGYKCTCPSGFTGTTCGTSIEIY